MIYPAWIIILMEWIIQGVYTAFVLLPDELLKSGQ